MKCGRYVGKKQKRVERHEIATRATSTRSLEWHRPPRRSSPIAPASATAEKTDEFIQDLRQRVIGAPEISTDGYHPYKNAIRDAFSGSASHGVIVKTYSVTNLAVKDAARRYSPAEVVAVEP